MRGQFFKYRLMKLFLGDEETSKNSRNCHLPGIALTAVRL
jgi:hypothetical protein